MMPQSAVAALLNESPSSKSTSARPASSVSSRLRSNRQIHDFEQNTSKDSTAISLQTQSLDLSTDATGTPANTLGRMTRQRTATVPTLEEVSLHKDDHNQTQSATSSESVSQICLCQPDPKIPRPRNAFILYRQHHQQNIISQHRGLSNPEISKIAGQLWQAEPEGVKNTWKAFAEEEKARHAQQYPDYRFQPRHKTKASPITAPGERARCAKCGGRSITANSSPFPTPFPQPNTSTASPSLPTPQTSVLGPSRKMQGAMSNSNGFSIHKDNRYGATGSPVARRFPDAAIELSDPKRRRYESYGAITPAKRPEAVRTTFSNSQNATLSQQSYHSPRVTDSKRVSLPVPPEVSYSVHRTSISHSASSPPLITPHTTAPTMGPPPGRIPSISSRNGLHAYPATPITMQNHGLPYPPTPRGRNNSESLRLAPLLSPAAGEHRRSIGAMIMSIPVVGKLGQLRRIAPPIKEPPLDSPPFRVRGSIIAIEGDDGCVAEAMLAQLETFLRRNDEFDVRVCSGPRVPGQLCKLKDYIDAVSEWHDETKKIFDFVTGVDYQRSERHGASEPHPHRTTVSDTSTISVEDAMHTAVEDIELREGAQKAFQAAKLETQTQESTNKVEMSPSPEYDSHRQTTIQEHASKIPLLLISNYILHGSDAWSSALPINDVYSPADHWAWTATLWRGVLGADLTVYVRNIDRERDEPMSAGGVGAPATEKKVEMKDDVAAILVNRENGKVDDGAVRRVAFEIGEWVRTQAGKQF